MPGTGSRGSRTEKICSLCSHNRIASTARDLPQWRQESLLRTLEAASNQMGEGELWRAGPGPPPLITFKRAVPPPSHLQPRLLSSLLPASAASEAPSEMTSF